VGIFLWVFVGVLFRWCGLNFVVHCVEQPATQQIHKLHKQVHTSQEIEVVGLGRYATCDGVIGIAAISALINANTDRAYTCIWQPGADGRVIQAISTAARSWLVTTSDGCVHELSYYTSVEAAQDGRTLGHQVRRPMQVAMLSVRVTAAERRMAQLFSGQR